MGSLFNPVSRKTQSSVVSFTLNASAPMCLELGGHSKYLCRAFQFQGWGWQLGFAAIAFGGVPFWRLAAPATGQIRGNKAHGNHKHRRPKKHSERYVLPKLCQVQPCLKSFLLRVATQNISFNRSNYKSIMPGKPRAPNFRH